MNPTPRSLAPRTALRVAFAALALAVAASPARALEDKAQQSCLNAVTKAFAAMTKAEAKEAAVCIKLASMEALPQPSVEACIAADAKGKVAGSRTKAAAAIAKACTKAPSFGTSDLTGATAVSGASGVRTALLQGLFGSAIGDSLATKAGDSAATGCQAAILKAVDRCWSARVAAYSTCAAEGLATSITNADALGACRDADPDGAVAAACVTDVQAALTSKCTGVNMDTRLPGCSCRYTQDCVAVTVANAVNRSLTASAALPDHATVLPSTKKTQTPSSQGPWIAYSYGNAEVVATKVVGREEDAPLACPLGALNVYTVQDASADTIYNNGVAPLLLNQGIRVMVQPLTPSDLDAGNSNPDLVQGTQAMPLYSQANDLLKLATRLEMHDLAPYKHLQVGDTLRFGLQHCLHDCESIYAATFPPFVFGARLLVDHFSASRSDIEGSVAALAAEAAAQTGIRLRWVGRTVADLHMLLADGREVQAFHALPADGSIVYELDPGVDPADVLALPAFAAFRAKTTADSLLLLE